MSDERSEDSAPQEPAGSGDLSPPLGEVAGALWSAFRSGSRTIAQSGRDRLEAYQARKDLQKLYEKLGRETVRLVEAGEITHPGLLVGAERIHRQADAVAAADAAESEGEE